MPIRARQHEDQEQAPASERNAKIKNVIRVSSGNFLEMYDFIVFGTPALCTYLIHTTGNRAAPGLWLSFAAMLGLVAALIFRALKTL